MGMPPFFDFTEPHMVLTSSIFIGIIVVFSILNCILRHKYKDYGRTRRHHTPGDTAPERESDYLRVGIIGRPQDTFDKVRLVRVVKEVFTQIARSAERAGSAGRVMVVSSLSKCGPFSYVFGEAKVRGWRTVGVYETDFQRANPCFRCSKYASVASSYSALSGLFGGKAGRTLPDAIARRADILIFITSAQSHGNTRVNREEEAKCAAAYDRFRGMKILYCLDGEDYFVPKKANNFEDALFGSGAKSEGNVDNTKAGREESARMKKRSRRQRREEQIQMERANGNEVEDLEDEMD